MKSDPTIGEHFKVKTVTDAEGNSAINVFMRDPTITLFWFASGRTMDPAAALKAHEPVARRHRPGPKREVPPRHGAGRDPAGAAVSARKICQSVVSSCNG